MKLMLLLNKTRRIFRQIFLQQVLVCLEYSQISTKLGTVSRTSLNASERASAGIRVTPMGSFAFSALAMLMTMVVMFLGAPAYANDVTEHVERGFSVLADDSLSSDFQWRGQHNSVRIETTLEADSNEQSDNTLHVASFDAVASRGVDNLDSVTVAYQSQGFQVGKISASWKTKAGKLTVGNDWTSFRDILSINKGFESADTSTNKRTVASQIKWLSANGFSISMEDAPRGSSYLTDDTIVNSNENTASPSLILSWQGGPGGVAGDYRITAMGRKLDALAEGQKFDGSEFTGWGLNVEGGWQMDDLFATLSVTFGKGIDSYILQRYGSNLVVTPNYLDGFSRSGESGTSLSIRPSLYYSLNNNSNFHVSLGHYTADDSPNNLGIDTLDTINMGYSWSPWPSTKLGVELVGQNVGGRNGVVEEFRQIKFDAQKRF